MQCPNSSPALEDMKAIAIRGGLGTGGDMGDEGELTVSKRLRLALSLCWPPYGAGRSGSAPALLLTLSPRPARVGVCFVCGPKQDSEVTYTSQPRENKGAFSRDTNLR